MNNDLSPAMLSLLGGILVAVAAVAGLGYLLYASIHLQQPPVAETAYPTGVLSTEFGSSGVFAKTRALSAPGGGGVAPAVQSPVSSGEIGKSDLGSLE